MNSPSVQRFVERGVVFPHPDSVFVDEAVTTDRIAADTVIHPGCRIRGAQTSIGPGCILGEEAPVTIEDCQLEADVRLKGGFASGAVFLAGASLGSSAHVRPGTIFEEQASGGHCVGVKQTLLMPFVALGSLINFCDCLIAGGTSRRNHSEVGSSFIHFNYTPHQDKATASLVGDVPRGVMLDQPPIFLGGQGGLVGPCRIEYGTIVAAGTVYRRDITSGGSLVFGQFKHSRGRLDYTQGLYGDIRRIVDNNVRYVGELLALRAWYLCVRSRFLSRTAHGHACLEGAVHQINAMVDERLRRMNELAAKMPESLRLAEARSGTRPSGPTYDGQRRLSQSWPGMAEAMASLRRSDVAPEADHPLPAAVANARESETYIDWVQTLTPEVRAAGTRWLQSIVQQVTGLWLRE